MHKGRYDPNGDRPIVQVQNKVSDQAELNFVREQMEEAKRKFRKGLMDR